MQVLSMSTSKVKTVEKLAIEDIVPGDPVATIWRWSVRNNWTFVPDFTGGEPMIDIRCANEFVTPGNTIQSAKNVLLRGIERFPGGVVRLSEVMKLKTEGEVTLP